MSLHPNWAALATIEFPWKTFVRGSNGTAIESVDKFSTYLNFQGDEAKCAYEAIINEECSWKGNSIDKSNGEKLKTVRKSSNSDALPNESPSKKNLDDSASRPTDVTTNSLLKAVEQDDLEFLKKNMNSDNVNVSDDFGWTPLMSAAYNGHLSIVEFLLQLGANRRIRERSGLTAAQLALKKNHLNVVAMLKRKNLCNKDNESDARLDSSGTCNVKTDEEQSEAKDAKGTDVSARSSDSCESECSRSEDERSGFYCEICKVHFKETSPKKHESSTLHIFNTKPKLPGTMYGISKQNKGYQMLLNTGWDEDCGLGPSGEGPKYPIKTILKKDRTGLGQPGEKDARVTHFKSGDISAVHPAKTSRQKTLKKRDREKLLNREAWKERALRIALS